MAKHLYYSIDATDEVGEQVYDAIVKSAPIAQLAPVPSGQKFTRIEVVMRSGLPEEQHGDERLIPSSPLD